MTWLTKQARRRLIRHGWNFMGTLPKKKTNMVLIIGPYTSDEDYLRLLALSDLTSFPIHFSYIKKDTSFPIRVLLKWAGAESGKKIHTMPHSADICSAYLLNEKNKNWSELPHYKSLHTNKTPIVLIGIDHHRQLIKFHNPFFLSGHISRDESFIRGYFANFYHYAQI